MNLSKRIKGTIAMLMFLCGTVCLNATTITVTNWNDSGSGSLRDAIATAVDGDTINFDPTVDEHPIVLTSGQLEINKSITICGNGEDKTIVDGNNGPSIFYFCSPNTANLQYITVQCAGSTNSKEGRGIMNVGTLSISYSTITNNKGRYDGVGIRNTGTLSISNSTISNNHGTGDGLQGGGRHQQ